MPRSLALACVGPNSLPPSCDCLAHRFGSAADGPERTSSYVSDVTEAEWRVLRPLLPVPAWLEGRAAGGQFPPCDARRGALCGRQRREVGQPACGLPAVSADACLYRHWQVTGRLAELHDRLRTRVRGQLRQRTVGPPLPLPGMCGLSASDCRRTQTAMTHDRKATMSAVRSDERASPRTAWGRAAGLGRRRSGRHGNGSSVAAGALRRARTSAMTVSAVRSR